MDAGDGSRLDADHRYEPEAIACHLNTRRDRVGFPETVDGTACAWRALKQ